MKKWVRALLGDKRTYRLKRYLGYPPNAFHNDELAIRLVDLIIKNFNPTSFAETGLFQGATTRFVAHQYPKLSIHSFEVNEEFYNSGRETLRCYPNIQLHLGSSDVALKSALETTILGERPLFYLDAHWYNYWPLRDEIGLIGTYLKEAIILIDDFQVPGHPEFAYDVGGKIGGTDETLKCNLEYVLPAFSKKHSYQIFFPNYGKQEAKMKELVGYALIFQNINSALLESFLHNHLVVKSFRQMASS
jgi:hypothetical protein